MTGDAFSTITQDNVLAAFHHAMALSAEGRHAEGAVPNLTRPRR
jgi:hypothetical protein